MIKEGEEEIVDDLPVEEEEDLFGDEKDESDEEDEKEAESPDEDKETRLAKAERKVRTMDKKYSKAVERIHKLEAKKEGGKPLTEAEQKDLDAEKWFEQQYDKSQKKQKDREAEESQVISEELDDVLDENPTLKESVILDLIEEYAEMGVRLSPRQALKIHKKTPAKKETKDKPKMPRSKRGDGKVETKSTDRNSDEYKKMSYGERMANARKNIQDKYGDKLK